MGLNLGKSTGLWWQARIDNAMLKKDAAKTGSIFKGLGAGIKNAALFSGVGIAGALAVRQLIKVNTKFEKSISVLSSLTGAVGQELEFYKKKAIELGETTTQTASQVADAFRLIGSQMPILLQNKEALADVTKATITLSEAAQIDVPIAAKALTNSLNQTGAGAEKTGEYINILAAASQKGAGTIPYLNSALEKSAKVAHDSNLTYAEMVSAIEMIAPAMSEPSSAGLHFRTVLLRLQKQGFGFSTGMFDLQEALGDVRNELDSIKDPAKKAAKETEIFGIRSITVGKVLLENRDKFKEFAQTISGTNTAYEQAKTNTDNLEGSWKKLQSAFEGAILKNSNFMGSLKGIVDSLTDLVFWFGKNWEWIDKLLKAFLIYTAAIKGTAIALRLYTSIQKLATIGMTGFNKAMKANAIGIIISGVYLAVQAFKAFNKENKDATRTFVKFEKAGKIYNEVISKAKSKSDYLFGSLTKLKRGTKEYNEALSLINKEYGKILPNMLTQKSTLDDIKKAQKFVNDELIRGIAIESQRQELIDAGKRKLDAERQAFDEYSKITNGVLKENTSLTFEWFKAATKAGVSISAIQDALKKEKGYNVSGIQLRNLTTLIKGIDSDYTGATDSINKFYQAILKTLNVPTAKSDCPEGYHKDKNGQCVKDNGGDGDGDVMNTGQTEYQKQLEHYKKLQELARATMESITTDEKALQSFRIEQQISYLEFVRENSDKLEKIDKDIIDKQILGLKVKQKELFKVNEVVKKQAQEEEHLTKAEQARIDKITKGFELVGSTIASSFEEGKFSAEAFGNAVREAMLQVISALIGKAVASGVAKLFEEHQPLVALALAAPIGAAIYSIMNAVIPKFEHGKPSNMTSGGIVPGMGNSDSQLGYFTPDEMVANKKQQANLLWAIANGGLKSSRSEMYLKDINNSLKSQRSVVMYGNIAFEVINGNLTGKKVML